jgi:hypothetical protein
MMMNTQQSTPPSLKSSQLAAIHRMLAFNSDTSSALAESHQPDGILKSSAFRQFPAGSAHNQWKIVVYDAHCRSIISPVMNVSDLRSRGVTLHLLISSDREPIPDVPVIYFIQPTKENVAILARDCAKRLYRCAHINFVSKLPRELMEEFAKLVVSENALDVVASLHDQYLDFCCLEQRLFSLNYANSYTQYNGPHSDADVEKFMTQTAQGLFSVVATLSVVPIIRCPRGGAPEMVARKLNQMIVEHPTLMLSLSARKKHSSSTNPLSAASGGGSAISSSVRPLLVILDRNDDLVTPIQQTSTYQALIDDVLQHKANRVEFTVQEKNEDGSLKPKVIPKKYDLDADTDPFYSKHKFNTFPEAIESNSVELQQVTEQEAEVRSKTMGTAVGSSSTTTVKVADDSATDLATAVDSLPVLLEKKKQLEIHTSILQAVMNEVAARDIPSLYELQSSLATGSYKNDLKKAYADVMKMVKDPTKGNIGDKVRLICVYALATTCPSSSVDDMVHALKEACDTLPPSSNNKPMAEQELALGTRAIGYIKHLRSMKMIPMMGESAFSQVSAAAPKSGGAGGSTDLLSSFVARAQTQATGLLAKATQQVGSMLGKIHKHHLTRVVENLCDPRPNTEDDTYLYLDPKVGKGGEVDVKSFSARSGASTPMLVRPPTRDVIAFMIGGGCYTEYQNLQMISNEKRSVTYGSTEIISPSTFLSQLSQLSG